MFEDTVAPFRKTAAVEVGGSHEGDAAVDERGTQETRMRRDQLLAVRNPRQRNNFAVGAVDVGLRKLGHGCCWMVETNRRMACPACLLRPKA